MTDTGYARSLARRAAGLPPEVVARPRRPLPPGAAPAGADELVSAVAPAMPIDAAGAAPDAGSVPGGGVPLAAPSAEAHLPPARTATDVGAGDAAAPLPFPKGGAAASPAPRPRPPGPAAEVPAPRQVARLRPAADTTIGEISLDPAPGAAAPAAPPAKPEPLLRPPAAPVPAPPAADLQAVAAEPDATEPVSAPPAAIPISPRLPALPDPAPVPPTTHSADSPPRLRPEVRHRAVPGAATGPAPPEPSPVEISIGTVEVVAEPAPAPAPDRGVAGFDAYRALRNYEDWD